MSSPSLAYALDLIRMGFSPVPIPFRGKNPGAAVGKDWIKLRITEANAAQYFNGKPINIGVILGTPSNELVDIDLDCQQAIELAPLILPSTRTFGRYSKPASHWIYFTDDAGRIRQFQSPDGGMIVEYRANGGQTVFPGSVHESGEVIEWHNDAPVTLLTAETLRASVAQLAAAVLLVRAGVVPAEAAALAKQKTPSLASLLTGPDLSRASAWLGLNVNTSPAEAKAHTGDAFDRARAYLRTCDPAIAGQGGHKQTLWVAICLKRGFLLSDSDTLSLLGDYNASCQPPWSQRELEHKVKSAAAADRIQHADGWLLNADRPEWRSPPPPDFDDDEPEPQMPPWIDPETGEVRDNIQAAAKVQDQVEQPALDGLIMPEGYEFRSTGLVRVQRKPGNLKTCTQCKTVSRATNTTCPQCTADLPVEPDITETVHQIAHVPIWIGAELGRREGNLWRIDARFGKRVKHVVVERSLKHDGRKLSMAIEAPGIPLVASKNGSSMLAEYLDRFDVINRKRIPRKQARTQFGWTDRCRAFLLGREPIGTDAIALYSANTSVDRIADWFVPVGKPARWRDTAQAMLDASPVAALVLSASVASPMLRPFGWAPIGVALAALGGGNKSTLLRLAASVWGYHGDAASRQAAGLVGNGNATALGIVGQFGALADLPHLVDEMRANVTDPRSRTELEGALHQLIDGVERTRMKRDGSGPRDNSQSTGCAVIATEIDSSEFLVKGGAVRRYLPAPAPYASGPLGQHIEPLCRSYGHAGLAIVQGLVLATSEERTAMAERKPHHLEYLREGLDPANESLRTWSDQIAVALAAADVACQLAPDMMPDHETWTSQILAVWASLRSLGEDSSESSSDTVRKAFDLTLTWIATMRAHFQPSTERARLLDRLPDEERIRRLRDIREPILGRIQECTNEGEQDEVVKVVNVVQPALQRFLAEHGYSAGTMVSAWAGRGWLMSNPNRRGLGTTTRLGGGRAECYRLVIGGAP
jgi:hypothetical protein